MIHLALSLAAFLFLLFVGIIVFTYCLGLICWPFVVLWDWMSDHWDEPKQGRF